jgi:hypothetical protein
VPRSASRWSIYCHPLTVAALATFLLAPGCGAKSEILAVSGEVTFAGSPITSGEITFLPADGSIRLVSAPIVDGRYHVEEQYGALPGRYDVAIRGYREAKSKGPGNPYAADAVPTEQFLPPQFNDRTELSVEISVEQTQHDFHLAPSGT